MKQHARPASRLHLDADKNVMSQFRLFVCLVAVAFAGCGVPAPTLDTTTDASTEASLKAMTAGMSDAEKTRFQGACDIAALPGQFDTKTQAMGNTQRDKLQSLNGLTVDEIRTKASALRVKLSQ
jgi:hypothetical protein